ncbi:MAG: serine/threonine protein kinase, partial [Myxococcales bacterium]|nr:serine/threonine protein kinase [Myxococcales bacterium]
MVDSAEVVTVVPPRIGHYRVLGLLATGGMSELYLGREPSGRAVVIKRILPHLARQKAFVSMFIDEARIGTMIHHPNVVEIYELGQAGGELFMVMELLEGENTSSLIRRIISRDQRLGYGLAAHIVAEACRGLHAAHALTDDGRPLDIVHRDVSPQNVFVTYDGAVKVLDFGIAAGSHRLTHTATGQLKGKFAYMSPEQCRGEALDLRSDVFSLGVVLYELTTQRRLFARKNELQVLKAVCEDPIARPSRDLADYPPMLEDICLRALARDKRQRYASAAAMADDLVAATQFLLGATDPRRVLGDTMRALFADRIAQKATLVQHVRAGTDPGALPTVDADEGVEVPEVSLNTPVQAAPTRASSSLTAASGPVPVPPPAPPRRRAAVAAAVGAIAVAAFAAAVLLGRAGGDRDAAAATSSPVAAERAATVTPTAPAPPAPPPTVPAPPPAPATIALRLETTPPGATITLDGEPQG